MWTVSHIFALCVEQYFHCPFQLTDYDPVWVQMIREMHEFTLCIIVLCGNKTSKWLLLWQKELGWTVRRERNRTTANLSFQCVIPRCQHVFISLGTSFAVDWNWCVIKIERRSTSEKEKQIYIYIPCVNRLLWYQIRWKVWIRMQQKCKWTQCLWRVRPPIGDNWSSRLTHCRRPQWTLRPREVARTTVCQPRDWVSKQNCCNFSARTRICRQKWRLIGNCPSVSLRLEDNRQWTFSVLNWIGMKYVEYLG